MEENVPVKHNRSTLIRLFTFHILFAVLLIALLIIFSRLIATRYAKRYAETLLGAINMEQHSLTDDTLRILNSWKTDIEEKGLEKNPCLSTYIKQFVNSPRYTTYAAFDPQGNFICTKIAEVPKTGVGGREKFKVLTDTKQFTIGDFQLGQVSKEASVAFGLPILDEKGNIEVIISLALDLGWINDYMTGLNLPKDSELIITDKNGVIEIYHPTNPSKVGTTGIPLQIFSIILAQKKGFVTAKGADGVRRLYVFQPFTVNDKELSAFQMFGLKREMFPMDF